MRCLICKAFISSRYRAVRCKRCDALNVDMANPTMFAAGTPWDVGWIATTNPMVRRFAYRVTT